MPRHRPGTFQRSNTDAASAAQNLLQHGPEITCVLEAYHPRVSHLPALGIKENNPRRPKQIEALQQSPVIIRILRDIRLHQQQLRHLSSNIRIAERELL